MVRAATLFAVFLWPAFALAQTQTTGRIAGTVKDPHGAVIVGAEVAVINKATGDERKVTADETGNYALARVQPGAYRVIVAVPGFTPAVFDPVQVVITETTLVNADLVVGGPGTVSVRIDPLVQAVGPQLGLIVDSRAVVGLPLAARNFTQILSLSPGVATYL